MFAANKVQAYVQLTRPQNASAGVLLYSCGYILSTAPLGAAFFVGLVILLLVRSVATVQNDIEDFEIDRANKRQSALLDKTISIEAAKSFTYLLATGAVLLAVLSGHRQLSASYIALFLALASLYNLRPVRTSRRPVTSIITMGLCYGVLPFAYGFLLGGGHMNAYFWAMIALLFLARASVSIMKDYKDAAGDKLHNKHTFYLHYGGQLTAWISLTAGAVSYFGIFIVLAALGGGVLFWGILLLASLFAVHGISLRMRLFRTRDEKKLTVIFAKSALNQARYEGMLLLCLLASSK